MFFFLLQKNKNLIKGFLLEEIFLKKQIIYHWKWVKFIAYSRYTSIMPALYDADLENFAELRSGPYSAPYSLAARALSRWLLFDVIVDIQMRLATCMGTLVQRQSGPRDTVHSAAASAGRCGLGKFRRAAPGGLQRAVLASLSGRFHAGRCGLRQFRRAAQRAWKISQSCAAGPTARRTR